MTVTPQAYCWFDSAENEQRGIPAIDESGEIVSRFKPGNGEYQWLMQRSFTRAQLWVNAIDLLPLPFRKD